jgi:hypothetical protein
MTLFYTLKYGDYQSQQGQASRFNPSWEY